MIAWWSVAGEPWTVLLASAPALAIAIDRLLGEPPLRWHPVAWMGRWLAWAGERLAPRVGEARVLSDARVFWFAALSWCAAAAAFFAVAWLFQGWVLTQPAWLAALALGLFLKPLLAWAMLHDEVLAVERALGESLDKVVVARIVSAEKHPEADRLQVCRVDAGQGEPLQIVCGAPNARAGLAAPLALVGAKFGDFQIKTAKLRGVESNGMLCSAKELGIDADASGLLELPDDAPVGTPVADYLGLPDASIEIKLTPNRADCFSVRGIAYDVAASTGSEVVPFDASPVASAISSELKIELDAGADAPRYCGRIVEGVDATAKPPVWLAERLRRSGVRPV
ncbi:YtpR family tRNA-binding protein, partial [Ottowia beijingensis]|uniref:YtpR family tRNA-binding protein n=1 Tax=Ottowia beijingensis TaxID=1207057 RepID=UPI002FD95A1D